MRNLYRLALATAGALAASLALADDPFPNGWDGPADFGAFAWARVRRDGLEFGEGFSHGGAGFRSADASGTPVGPGGGVDGMAAQSWAQGSLATGQMHLFAEAGFPNPEPLHEFVNYYAEAKMRLADTFTLANATDQDLYVPYEFTLDGVFEGYSHTRIGLTGPTDGIALDSDREPDYIQGRILTGRMLVPAGGEATYGFDLRMAVNTLGSNLDFAKVDYSHTLRFNWALPAVGVSYTSASGVLNPGAMAPVPEPASLIALTCGAVGLLRRRWAG